MKLDLVACPQLQYTDAASHCEWLAGCVPKAAADAHLNLTIIRAHLRCRGAFSVQAAIIALIVTATWLCFARAG